jgi:hypothetical protein
VTITISHNRTEGTLVHGTSKGDGTAEVLKVNGFRWFRSLGCWGLTQSRDKAANRFRIDQAASALRAAGFEVAVEIDDDAPSAASFADREAERYDRAEDRADRYGDRADKAAAAGAEMWDRVREQRAQVPFGQPMMPDHHSYAADRNRRDRWARTERRATEEMDRGAYWAARAEAAERYRQHREDIPTTLRRIEQLEARQRRLQRHLTGDLTDSDRARFIADLQQVEGELDYWREHVAQAETEGVKVWSKADFAKGDFVNFGHGWFEVTRVNAKSVTVPAMVMGVGQGVFTMALMQADGRQGWTDTIPYSKVRGQAAAEEIRQRYPDVFAQPIPRQETP